MSAKRTRNGAKPRRADELARLKAKPDSEIDYSDIPELGPEFFRAAKMLMPEEAQPVTMRLDRSVIDFFKRGGPGYQARINAVLRAYVETVGKAEKR
ncbi:BrnA antitoxin family protein [uncultured Parvibaculum sp.]|uniref:BrnA antitoxin family protein n=1 Tax=uncultured Parvibaculum sp. TaxID=291828 RepID=UPI0030EE32ED|tara:strand:- start:77083 stop:77373 length:291 start_codon:yes stop_codon:yes gene_type:complete